MEPSNIFEGNVYWIYDDGWYHFYCNKSETDKTIITDETKLENASIQTTILSNAIIVKGLQTYKRGIKRETPVYREMLINGNYMIHFS